jgi:hypothetical protein
MNTFLFQETIRGRITLAVVNDALQGVVNVVREKYSVLQGNHNRQHYRKYWTLHRALEVEEHGTEPWVSEQELRSDCAFFDLVKVQLGPFWPFCERCNVSSKCRLATPK